MKHILTTPELAAVVKTFVADPKMEFGAKSGKPCGFTQRQQVLLMMKLLTEAVFTDCDNAQWAAAFRILNDLANGSAARQAMESSGILAKTEGGKRGADVDALIAKFAPPADA